MDHALCIFINIPIRFDEVGQSGFDWSHRLCKLSVVTLVNPREILWQFDHDA